MSVFESILANPVTNKKLTELLKRAAQADAAAPGDAPSPFQSVYTAGQTLSNRLLDGKILYDLKELENLHLYFLSLIEAIEKAKAGCGTAKVPEPPFRPGDETCGNRSSCHQSAQSRNRQLPQ